MTTSEHVKSKPKRAARGRWSKGQSGNPGGRAKRADDVKALAATHTEEAIRRLAFWMRSKDAKASVAAANALLDRAWGKPIQAHEGSVGMPIQVLISEVDARL